MAKIIQIHVWMHDKSGRWREPEVVRKTKQGPKIAKGKRLVLEPESDNPTMWKLQIARALMPYRKSGKLQSYYVVVVAQKDDGEIAYRTAVPMTMVL